MKVKNTILKYQIEISVFLLFMVDLVFHMPFLDQLDSWCTTYYTIGYEFGFSSRLLIGTIVGFFFPYLSRITLYILLIALAIILAAVAALVIGHYIKLLSRENRTIGVALCVLWIASPASITYLFLPNTFGRMDMFLVVYTLLIFLVCFSVKRKEKWILVSFLVALAVLTHQVYVFILFALPAAIFVYEFFSNNKKEYLPYGILLFGVCFGLALYLQLFSGVNCATAKEMYEQAITRTYEDFVNETVIQFEYFGQFSDHWNAFGQYMIAGCIKCGLASCVLLAPLWIFIINIWRGYLYNTEKGKKLGAYIMLATHVAYIPIFIITVDWGRWLAGLLIFEFLLIMYLWAVEAPAMVICLRKKWEKIKGNPFPYMLMMILVACQGKFDAIDVSASAKRLVIFVEKWIDYIFM